MTEGPSDASIPTAPQAPEVIRIPPKDFLVAGNILSQRYEIRACLGKGGMGVVYRAYDRELREEIALKIVLPERMGDPDVAEKLRREVKLARNVSHPNVCRVYDLGESDGLYFLTMQLVRGRTLREKLLEGPLKPEEALDLLDQIAGGLSAVHAQGVLHRDLKPENVLVSEDSRAMVADFGIARKPAGEKAVTAGIEGTAPYMSPEQLRGEPMGHGADLFSLGVVAFEMLTGRLPFKKGTPAVVASAILSQAPEPLVVPGLDKAVVDALQRVLDKAMAKRPDERFASVGEFREALAKVRAVQPGSNQKPAEKTAPRARRVFLSIALAAGLGISAWWIRSLTTPAPAAVESAPPSAQTAPVADGPPSVLVEPFNNLSGEKEWEGLSSSAPDAVARGLQEIPGLLATASNERRTESATWVLRGSIQKVGGSLRLSARFEPNGDAIASEMIEIDGAPDRVPQMLDDFRVAAVDEARLILRRFQRTRRAVLGTANTAARGKLLAYYDMIGPAPRSEHFEVGLRMLNAALEADPAYVPARIERGYLASIGAGPGTAAEQMARAVADVDRAVEIAASDAGAHVMRCRVLQVAIEAGGRPTDAAIARAVDACTAALQADPSSPFVRIALARIEDRRCRDDEAMRLLQATVELDRSVRGRALRHLTSLAVQNDRLELADRTTEQLVALAEEERRLGPRALTRRAGLSPVSAAHFWRGAVLLRLGRLAEAKLAFLSELSQISPGQKVSKSAGAFEAASAMGLLRIAKAQREPAPLDLERRLSRIEAQYSAEGDPEGAWIMASTLVFVDPAASTKWIDRLSPASLCDQAVQRALIYRAADKLEQARKTVARCTPTQAWERSCVDRLRSLTGSE